MFVGFEMEFDEEDEVASRGSLMAADVAVGP